MASSPTVQYPLLSRDAATLAGRLDAPLDIAPNTGGIFHDFSTGAPGVRILGGERPCPGYIDSTTVGTGAGSQLVYAAASEVGFAGIPMWARLTSNSASSQVMTLNAASFVDKANNGGRIYLYFPVNVVQTRFATFFTDNLPVYLRLNTARNISVLDNGNNAKLTTSTVLSAGTVYRVEWFLDYDPSGTVMATLLLYQGHGTVPLDNLTTVTPFAAGTKGISANFGNVNGANLANKFLYFGAVGFNCDFPPGPYRGRQENSQTLLSPDGRLRYAFSPNGDLVQYANRPYKYTDGGTEIYLVQPGDEVGRWGNDGMRVGPGTGVGDPSFSFDNSIKDQWMDAKNRRFVSESYGNLKLHDPPDNAFIRLENINSPEDASYGYVGHKGSTVANSPVLTVDPSDIVNVNPRIWPTGVWEFVMQRRGHGIKLMRDADFTVDISTPALATFTCTGHGLVAGDVFTITTTGSLPTGLLINTNYTVLASGLTANTFQAERSSNGVDVVTSGTQSGTHTLHADWSYNIAEVLSPTQVQLTPIPKATASNLTWKLKIFPYPLQSELIGTNVGGTMGQPARMFPGAHAPIGKGASGVNTTSGSAVVDITALSAPDKALWTVGRRILINKDPTLANARPGRCFKIISVAGDGNSVTLDGTVPSTLNNVQWHVAASNDDGGAAKIVNFTMTETHDAQTDIVNWEDTLGQGWSSVKWQMVSDGTLWQNGVSSAPTAFQINSTGGCEMITGAGLMECLNALCRVKWGFQTGQGAGGTVTQTAGSKGNAVTLNKAHGRITMANASLGANTVVTFTLNSTSIGVNDNVFVQVVGGTGATPAGSYRAWAENPAAGSVTICLKNEDSSSHSDPVQLRFTVTAGTNG